VVARERQALVAEAVRPGPADGGEAEAVGHHVGTAVWTLGTSARHCCKLFCAEQQINAAARS
jgi:hypothetical protein